MKAITIRQPWASLIMLGIKDVENRTWTTKIRGEVLIHASKQWDKITIQDFTDEQIAAIPQDVLSDIIYKKLPTGCVLGKIEITDCVTNHPSIWSIEDCNQFILQNPKRFFIDKVKGQLGFWNYEIAVNPRNHQQTK